VTRHVVDGTEDGAEGYRALARRGLELRAGAAPRRRDGKRIVNVFLNSSLRTRTSMEAAAHNLGVHTVTLNPGRDAWLMEHRPGAVMDGDKPEHLADALPILSQFADAIAVRAFASLEDKEADRRDEVLSSFHRYARVPVLNLESARWHPLQGLADAATLLARFGDGVRGLPVTLTWAPHPKALPQAVPNQFLLTCAMLGASLTLAHPEGFDLDPDVVARASGLAAENGGSLRVTQDRRAALRGARVVQAKAFSGWSGYGRREDETARRLGHFGAWRVDGEAMRLTDDAYFMHCLPVRRNVVVTDEVIDSPRSLTGETGGLRMWTAMALLERFLGGGR
jgi:N-acetylornithine carbamoyltransferase